MGSQVFCDLKTNYDLENDCRGVEKWARDGNIVHAIPSTPVIENWLRFAKTFFILSRSNSYPAMLKRKTKNILLKLWKQEKLFRENLISIFLLLFSSQHAEQKSYNLSKKYDECSRPKVDVNQSSQINYLEWPLKSHVHFYPQITKGMVHRSLKSVNASSTDTSCYDIFVCF